MTIEQIADINRLLKQRELINRNIKSFEKAFQIDITVPVECNSLRLDIRRKSDLCMINAMRSAAIELLNEERDTITAQLKELGLEE